MTLPDTVAEYVPIALVLTLLIVPKVLQRFRIPAPISLLRGRTVDFDPAHGSAPRPAAAPD